MIEISDVLAGLNFESHAQRNEQRAPSSEGRAISFTCAVQYGKTLLLEYLVRGQACIIFFSSFLYDSYAYMSG